MTRFCTKFLFEKLNTVWSTPDLDPNRNRNCSKLATESGIYSFGSTTLDIFRFHNTGSGIRKKTYTDPDLGGKNAPDPGSGFATLALALGEQHGTVLYTVQYKYWNTDLQYRGSPEERTAGRQDELVSLHRVSITHLSKIKACLKFCRIGIFIQRLSNPDPNLHHNGKSDPDTGRRSTTLPSSIGRRICN